MDGKSHLAAGVIFSGVGLMVTDTPLQEIAMPLIIGGISGLAPDLDHQNSILTQKFSFPIRILMSVGSAVLTLYLAYQLFLFQFAKEYIIGVILVGATLLALSLAYMKPKTLLLISGIALVIVGILLPNTMISLVVLGLFVVIASRLKHRGLTHSLYFLIFWSIFSFLLQKEIGQNHIWLAGTLGYLSHLLTDDWFTKTKIKWIKTKEVMWLAKKLKRANN